MTNELISVLINNLNEDAKNQLRFNALKHNLEREPSDTGIRFRKAPKYNTDFEGFDDAMCFELASPSIQKRYLSRKNIFLFLRNIMLGIVGIGVLVLIATIISNKFGLNFFISLLLEIGIILLIILIIVLVLFLKKITYTALNQKISINDFQTNQINTIESDAVITVIAETYEGLSRFRVERLRQAKISYNIALALIASGILIIFFGVYLLFKKSITQGALTSGVGSISSVIGNTVLKFYKETNDRMDNLDKDLFTLNTAKVQYSLILKISNVSERNREFSKLIDSIGKIKK